MSHEIRTPLNAILGFVDIVAENEASEENIEYLSIVQKSGKHLLGIINDILDFSKIESGNLKLELVKVNPYENFEEIAELFYQRAKEKNIEFKTLIDPKLSKYIQIDTLRVTQVISNLLSNAVKFTPVNGSIIYKVDYMQESNSVYVSVKDTGIGIEKEKQEHIFEAFIQSDASTTREYGGTGLGLAISNRLATLMGGKLNLKSEIGKGSEFSFIINLPECNSCDIPTLKATFINPIKPIKQAKLAIKEMTFEGKKILLVEDNISNQMFMKVILKKLKLEYDLAGDGLEAIEAVKSNSYDAILMDENMPNLGGIQATKHILEYERENNMAHTPIIALTANAIKGDRERFLSAGMDEYLTKPINIKILAEFLVKFLNDK